MRKIYNLFPHKLRNVRLEIPKLFKILVKTKAAQRLTQLRNIRSCNFPCNVMCARPWQSWQDRLNIMSYYNLSAP